MAVVSSGYLLVVDENLTNRLRLTGMFARDVFEKVPEIENHIVLSTIDCILLESRLPMQELANKLRQIFPATPFVIAPLAEIDGVLPEDAWSFINAARGRTS